MRLIYLHGQQEDDRVDHITFPTGEQHIRIRGLEAGEDVTIVYNEPSGRDLIKLGLAVNICRRARVGSMTLVMPFIPYARQDTCFVESDPLSIDVFARLLNTFEFDRVLVADPHSLVSPALIRNVEVIHQHEIAAAAVMDLVENLSDPIALVAPDLGAAKKIKKLQQYLADTEDILLPVIQCDKTRDPVTGKITGFKILDGDPDDPVAHHCIMIDDLADAGGTFLGLADVIQQAGASGQSLYVTHGIFSKGTDHIVEKFSHVYATGSFKAQPGVILVKIRSEYYV